MRVSAVIAPGAGRDEYKPAANPQHQTNDNTHAKKTDHTENTEKTESAEKKKTAAGVNPDGRKVAALPYQFFMHR